MVKLRFVAPLVAAICIAGFAAPAHALPISGCVDDGSGGNVCDLYESDPAGNPSEYSKADNIYQPGDWLVGYTFLLKTGIAYDGTVNTVSDIVIIHEGFVELFSDGYASFLNIYNDAIALTPIDGITLDNGQVVGTPLFGGASSTSNDIGLIFEDVTGLAVMQNVAFLSGTGDTFNIHSDVPFIDPHLTPVPEPASLTLVGIGLAASLLRWRRKTAAKANL